MTLAAAPPPPRELAQPAGDEVLAHVFSNGGSHQLLHLAALFRARTGRALPLRGVVLDSCPGTGELVRSIRGLGTSLSALPLLQRWAAKFSLYTRFYVFGLLCKLLGRRNAVENARAGLNDAQLVRAEARRAYVYSEGDNVVEAVDIKAHALEAEKKGFNVKKEVFENTVHVAHIRGDEQRYWGIVQQIWTGEGW